MTSKKLSRNLFTIVAFVLSSITAVGQTTLYSETFSSFNEKGAYGPGNIYDTVGVTGWTINVNNCTLSASTDYFKVQSNLFRGRDLDGEAVWMSDVVDISGYAAAQLSVDFKAGNQNVNDPSWYLRVYYKVNGGPETMFATNGNNGWTDLSGNWGTAEQTNVIGNTVQIVVRVYNTSTSSTWNFDNVIVEGVANGTLADVQSQYVDNECTSSMTINWSDPIGFNPSSSDILIFAKQGSAINVGTPTLNSSSYTADSDFSGNGTAYENDAAAKCVYKGDGNSVDVTGLLANTTYHFLIFNVAGSLYSSGVTTNGTTITSPNNVSNFGVFSGNNTANLSWLYPSTCYDDFLIVARANSPVNSGTPTGDGSAYTANPSYGSGSSLLGGFVVYKGGGDNTTVLNLTNGVTYYFKIFTRIGAIWSPGVEVSDTPWNLPAPGDILITEHARNSTDFGVSYLELYNRTNQNISLNSAKIVIYYSNGTMQKVFDFCEEGSGQNVVPANGFLLLVNNSTLSNFESTWGVSLASLPNAINYNNSASGLSFATRYYALKLGGTINQPDGTLIDSTETYANNWGETVYQCPTGSWLGNYTTGNMASPGYFAFAEDLNVWQLASYNGQWANNTPPSSSTGGDNALIKAGTTLMPNGSQVNNMHIQAGAAISLDNNHGTVLGNLTLENDASVLITGSGNLTVNGITNVHRKGVTSSAQYNLWSSPFSSSINILATFTGANPCDIYCYRASDQQWKYDYNVPFSTVCNGNPVTFTQSHIIPTPEGNPDGNFDIGRGYFIPGVAGGLRTFSSSGALNNGTINVPVYGSSVATPPNYGGNDWNYIGNPYPSAISISSFIAGNPLVSSVYVYDGATGAFLTYGASSSKTIASCQGFAFNANTTTDGLLGNVTFTNSMRSADNSDFRSAKPAFDAVYVHLSNQTGWIDPLQVRFNQVAFDGVDEYDLLKLRNPNGMNLAANIDGVNYAITEMASFPEGTKTLPLYIETYGAGTFEIALDSIVNLPGMSVKLEDLENDVIYDLMTEKAVEFTTSEATVIKDRFYLVFSYENDLATGIAHNDASSNNLVYTDNQTLFVRNGNKVERVEIFNTLGQQLKVVRSNSPSLNIDIHSLDQGVYIIKVYVANGSSESAKITIVK